MPHEARIGPHVYRNKNGRYCIDLRWRDPDTGELRRHQQLLPRGASKEAATVRAAKLFNLALQGKELRPAPAPKEVVEVEPARTLQQALDHHVTWAATNRPRTLRDRKSLAKLIVRDMGDVQLAPADKKRAVEIADAVEAFKAERVRQKAGPATINRALVFLRTVLKQEVRAERIPAVVLEQVRQVEKLREPPARIRWLTNDEAKKLYAALPEHAHKMMMTLLHSGLRIGELVALRPQDVDLHERRLLVPDSKTGDARVVEVSKVLADVLRRALGQAVGDVLFPTPAGARYKAGSLSRTFTRAVKRAELTNLHAHDLRHDFATRAAGSVGLHVVGALLGHRPGSPVTARYAHAVVEQRRRAVDAVAASGFRPEVGRARRRAKRTGT